MFVRALVLYLLGLSLINVEAKKVIIADLPTKLSEYTYIKPLVKTDEVNILYSFNSKRTGELLKVHMHINILMGGKTKIGYINFYDETEKDYRDIDRRESKLKQSQGALEQAIAVLGADATEKAKNAKKKANKEENKYKKEDKKWKDAKKRRKIENKKKRSMDKIAKREEETKLLLKKQAFKTNKKENIVDGIMDGTSAHRTETFIQVLMDRNGKKLSKIKFTKFKDNADRLRQMLKKTPTELIVDILLNTKSLSKASDDVFRYLEVNDFKARSIYADDYYFYDDDEEENNGEMELERDYYSGNNMNNDVDTIFNITLILTVISCGVLVFIMICLCFIMTGFLGYQLGRNRNDEISVDDDMTEVYVK